MVAKGLVESQFLGHHALGHHHRAGHDRRSLAEARLDVENSVGGGADIDVVEHRQVSGASPEQVVEANGTPLLIRLLARMENAEGVEDVRVSLWRPKIPLQVHWRGFYAIADELGEFTPSEDAIDADRCPEA